MDLLSRFGLNMPSPVQLVLVIFALVGGFLLLLTLYLARHYRPQTRDRALVLYRRFIKKLAKAGYDTPMYESPKDLANRIGRQHPRIQGQLNLVVDSYLIARYRKTDRYELALEQLRKAVQDFKP